MLTIRDAPDPFVEPGTVRIRVRAAGVNFSDLLARQGLYPDAPKPPMVMGYEVAGAVEQVGQGVATLRQGDRVVALTQFAGQSELVVVPAGRVFPLLDEWSFEQGAAFPVVYLTAHHLLVRVAAVRPGEAVLAPRLVLDLPKIRDLRYGENPHQRAAFYSDLGSTLFSVAAARKMQGKELSFNNILDLDAAWRLATELEEPACVIVKHTNPCGTGVGKDPLEAYERAWACDPTSAFGGIIAFNGELDGETAKAIVERQFVEVIIAPKVSAAAVAERWTPAIRSGPNAAAIGSQ